MLRESQDYVSGQQICERFQVSRTAVWKVIKQLKEEGYEVEAILALGHAAHPLRPHTLQELDWKKVHQERF